MTTTEPRTSEERRMDALIASWTSRYLSRLPKPGEVPVGKVIVHNQVRPSRRLDRGFRAWLQALGDEPPVEICPCGWAPELGPHYRVRGIPPRL